MEDILSKIKELLGITDGSKDHIFNYYIDALIKKILSYCNLSELPDELEHIVIDKVITLYAETNGNLKSIQVGDTKREYFKNTSLGILDDVKSELNKYRKLKW